MIIRFTVPGEPRGWARARTGQGHHFVDGKTRSAKQVIASWAIEAGAQLTDGPVMLYVEAYLGIPQSASKKRQAAMLSGDVLPTKKPDFDNIQKLIGDALNGVVWRDDVQITDSVFRKRWSDQPRIEIEIHPMRGVTEQTHGCDRNRAAA